MYQLSNKTPISIYYLFRCDDKNRPDTMQPDESYSLSEYQEVDRLKLELDSKLINYDLLIERFDSSNDEVLSNDYIVANNYKNEIKYPFSEGDDYWTIYQGEVTWSCWDSVSEELHDLNPNKIYFATEKLANDYLKQSIV